MRIALISTPFVAVPPARYGGTELMIAELSEGLVQRGHEVTLFGTGDSTTSAELRYLYEEAQWPPNFLQDANHVSWAMQQVYDEDFDVVHANSAAALIYTRITSRPPLVYTLHHSQDNELSSFYRWFPDVHYVAISHDQASREPGVRESHVVHHGLDPAKYECRSSASDYVCFIARFACVKGPHTAIDVTEEAGVPIRMAGAIHPVDSEFGEREVTPRLRKDHVTVLGSIGMTEKVPLLRDSRALLAPIEWNEPFGLALIEAMLSGCPVVAFPRGSVPELVEEGVTGFIARDRDEMREIIRPGGPLDDFDRRRCRDRAIERFGRARMVAEYESVYAAAAGYATPKGHLARIA
ncbi:MAG TPA: glycosyltransferase family 4 protein [Gemmatimonadaceae bacterium]|nr:glycosyltransferase family 4 protein [Gemmatimonadaceae bacterium]